MLGALVVMLAAADVSAAGPAEHEPRLVVDVYPHATTGALAVGAALGSWALHLPVSVTIAIGPQTAIHAQLVVTYVDHRNRSPGWSVSASTGPLFSFGESALRGFFLCPQFTFQVSSAMLPLAVARTNGPLDLGREWSRAFLAGLEAGYQWTWEGRHIAVMIGGSVGYQYDGVTFVSELGIDRSSGRPSASERTQGFAFSINANLFRIGFAL